MPISYSYIRHSGYIHPCTLSCLPSILPFPHQVPIPSLCLFILFLLLFCDPPSLTRATYVGCKIIHCNTGTHQWFLPERQLLPFFQKSLAAFRSLGEFKWGPWAPSPSMIEHSPSQSCTVPILANAPVMSTSVPWSCHVPKTVSRPPPSRSAFLGLSPQEKVTEMGTGLGRGRVLAWEGTTRAQHIQYKTITVGWGDDCQWSVSHVSIQT